MDVPKLRLDVEEDEGRVRHLYLCSKGHVTVGVGARVFSVQEALALPLAPREAIVSDYELVRQAPAGMRASYYAGITRARMSDAAIDTLLDAKIRKFAGEIERQLPGFAGYPDQVQRAVFNMAYNLGLAGFMKYEKLRAAIEARDWQAAAEECHRRGISEARNKRTAELFAAAAGGDYSTGGVA